jgi:hypothetical protein
MECHDVVSWVFTWIPPKALEYPRVFWLALEAMLCYVEWDHW